MKLTPKNLKRLQKDDKILIITQKDFARAGQTLSLKLLLSVSF